MNTDMENRREDFLDRHEGECVACKYHRTLYRVKGRYRNEYEYCAYHNEYLEDIYECDNYERA